MAIPPISALPTAPSRADAPDTFADDADTFVAALPTFRTETNALAAGVDQALDDSLQAVTDAEEQRDLAAAQVTLAGVQVALATTQADRAEDARDIASAIGNYQGEYNPDTTYQIGMSVSESGAFFIAKTVNTGVAPVDGVNWQQIVAGIQINYQSFPSSGTWTKPEGVTLVLLRMWGAGGSGAAHTGALSGSIATGGAGGGFFQIIVPASALSPTETVTVGAGGARVFGTATGNAGGASSIGLYSVNGGAAGNNSNTAKLGGAVLAFGENGGATNLIAQTTVSTLFSGAGGGSGVGDTTSNANTAGASVFGGNGGNFFRAGSNGNAGDGQTPGGGGGGRAASTSAARSSGAGGNGLVEIWAW